MLDEACLGNIYETLNNIVFYDTACLYGIPVHVAQTSISA